jgi:Flp pilus assembly protein TadG
MKYPTNRRAAAVRERTRESGASAVVTLVLLVPVVFALLGFAVDLGMMYSVKSELKAAANSMALAAAEQLIGTGSATAAADAAAQLTIETTSGFGNRYYFHGMPIGQSTGSLVSTVSDPAYFTTAAGAIASGASGATDLGSGPARHVRITITGPAQLLFWSFLPVAGDRNNTILATAVAGISPPLCQACGIEPFAVAPLNPADTTDFGFTMDTKYSLAYLCNPVGGNVPPALPGSAQLINYLMLNRYDLNALVLPDEASQGFRDGAGGLPGNANQAQACFRVNTPELIWISAVVNRCSAAQVAPIVTAALCGLDTRFESTTPGACGGIPSIDTLESNYSPDPDTNNYDSYTDYTGNGRRIVTIPIVDTLNAGGNMTVLGFRQFLLIPAQGAFNLNPADPFGRFVAMYIGSVAPLKQGRFDGCQLSAGPGKVVLHQ